MTSARELSVAPYRTSPEHDRLRLVGRVSDGARGHAPGCDDLPGAPKTRPASTARACAIPFTRLNASSRGSATLSPTLAPMRGRFTEAALAAFCNALPSDTPQQRRTQLDYLDRLLRVRKALTGEEKPPSRQTSDRSNRLRR